MRTILHSDLNNFYATVECAENPKLKNEVVVVCGNPNDRHGIVLAKNMRAKNLGIKTGMVLWEARKICPQLVTVIADFEKYLAYSRRVRAIYERYTDCIEPFGIDECWLDVTHSTLFGTGEEIADKLRAEITKETGLTASIGVSFNKIFAKLGSDMKKPDATTKISLENFKEKIWALPASALLYVGRATSKKLIKFGIETIGDLALANREFLRKKLGKWGETLSTFSRGEDESPVKRVGQTSVIKSVGNSLTARHDLLNLQEVEALFFILSESIAMRMRKYGIGKARTVSVWCRKSDLSSCVRQCKFLQPTNNSYEICQGAFELFKKCFTLEVPVRALGVSVCDFNVQSEQLSFFDDDKRSLKFYLHDSVLQKVRRKYGYNSLLRARVFANNDFSCLDVENEHTIHPVSFFKA